MKIGFIGLGKMGYNMVAKLIDKKHVVLASDRSIGQVKLMQKRGAIATKSMSDMLEKLESPRVIWLMIPHQVVDETLNALMPKLKKGDIIIDGGNSHYVEGVSRSKKLAKKGMIFMDIGVSGGLAAAKTGYCMMAGGNKQAYKKIVPIIRDMCVPKGYGYFGESGSGHYVKMVHNAIEYGMMQALGEGLDMIENAPFKHINQVQLTDVWNHGSIIRSFLNEMANKGLKKHPGLRDVDGFIANTGEGRWAVDEAKKIKVSIPVISKSLDVRLESAKKKNYGTKVVAVLRDEFGGHGINKK